MQLTKIISFGVVLAALSLYNNAAFGEDLKPAIAVPPAPVKKVNPILHPIKWADTVPMSHPRAWRVFRTRVKPSAEFAMSAITCVFSIAGAIRR